MNNDDNSLHPSVDDAMEPVGDIYNPARDQEKLDEDNDTPASPPMPNDEKVLPKDHPEFDTDIDKHEVYDEGEVGATDVDTTKEP